MQTTRPTSSIVAQVKKNLPNRRARFSYEQALYMGVTKHADQPKLEVCWATSDLPETERSTTFVMVRAESVTEEAAALAAQNDPRAAHLLSRSFSPEQQEGDFSGIAHLFLSFPDATSLNLPEKAIEAGLISQNGTVQMNGAWWNDLRLAKATGLREEEAEEIHAAYIELLSQRQGIDKLQVIYNGGSLQIAGELTTQQVHTFPQGETWYARLSGHLTARLGDSFWHGDIGGTIRISLSEHRRRLSTTLNEFSFHLALIRDTRPPHLRVDEDGIPFCIEDVAAWEAVEGLPSQEELDAAIQEALED